MKKKLIYESPEIWTGQIVVENGFAQSDYGENGAAGGSVDYGDTPTEL